jgi:hypothetical protein
MKDIHVSGKPIRGREGEELPGRFQQARRDTQGSDSYSGLVQSIYKIVWLTFAKGVMEQHKLRVVKAAQSANKVGGVLPHTSLRLQ